MEELITLYFKKCKCPLKNIKDTYKRIDTATNKFDKLDKGYYFLKDIKEYEDYIEIPYIFYNYKWYEDNARFRKDKIKKIEVLK